MYGDGRPRRSRHRRDLLRRVTRVVVQNDRAPLPRRELGQMGEKGRNPIIDLLRSIDRCGDPPPALELGRRDPERNAPYPIGWRPYSSFGPECLSERLCHRIVRDLSIPRVSQQCPPETLTVLSIGALDVIALFHPQIVHARSITQGRGSDDILYTMVVSIRLS